MALRALSDRTEVRFEDSTYDLRKFDVQSGVDNKKIGNVTDVLIDERGRTRYLAVKLDDGRNILVPGGQMQADRTRRTVTIPGMTRDDLKSVPAYSGDPATVDQAYESRLTTAYEGAYHTDRFHERADYRSGYGRNTTRQASGTLAPLDQLDDIDVASGEPDPRGWKVIGRDGKTIGKVDHLIGDTGAMKVRYLDIDVDRGITKKDFHVLVPIGHVALDRDDKRVRISGLDTTTVATLPAYTHGPISRADEERTYKFFSGAYTDEQRYEHPRFRDEHLYGDEQRMALSEEELKVGKRERVAGEVDVRKHVETEHVREPVQLHREEVEVERRPVSRETRGSEMRDDEIRVPVTEEEVVVEKRPRVKEEIVVRKRDITDTEYVDEDIRKERADIDERGETRR